MSEWQPIETAPKDGTIIDVWVLRHRIAFRDIRGARWTYAYWSKRDGGGWVVFDPEADAEMWIEQDDLAGNTMVTHWMPLPEPPKLGIRSLRQAKEPAP